MQLIHHPLYVLLAVLVAILGSWTALDLFLRVKAWVGQPRAAWLIAASVAMGLSIWAMHFIAILGFEVGTSVLYDPALTALALAIAVGATGFGFAIAGRGHVSRGQLIGAGLVMGVGICVMHYVGLSAMRSSTVFAYRPGLVALSFVIAIVASTAALAAIGRGGSRNWRTGAAIALGLAIVLMHYCCFASVKLLPGLDSGGSGGVGALSLAAATASGTMFVLFLASVAALFDRRFEAVAAVEAKRSEAQLRALLDQMPIGIIVSDAPSGEVRYVNPEAKHLLGRQTPDGPPWDWHIDGAPQDAENHPLFRAVKLGQRTEATLQTVVQVGGSKVTFEQTAAPVRDANGRISQGVLTFHDVTTKLHAEDALRQSQRMEGIGQLTGGVAHDFNNLLTAIIGSLTLATRRVEDERAKQLIDNALQAGRRGARLIEQLMAFSRRQQLDAQPVDVNAAIGRMSGLFASTLGGTVKVISDLKVGLPAALADPAQLELALLNLALNARDAMPGGGEMILGTSLATLGQARSENEPGPGRYVCITVADTGRGMPPQVAARAFEPFFTTKIDGRGSGLGLSQVLGLAKQLGGGVRIDCVEDRGCVVSVYLPVSREPASEAPVPQAALAVHQAAVAGSRVLVVDDDDDVRRFVADLLTDSGCTVRTEADGLAGLEALAAGPVDLMVLDYAMPGMTGAEVARQVRERYPQTPLLIMTGYLEHQAVLAELGAQPILQKPFEPGDLLSRVAATLKRTAEA